MYIFFKDLCLSSLIIDVDIDKYQMILFVSEYFLFFIYIRKIQNITIFSYIIVDTQKSEKEINEREEQYKKKKDELTEELQKRYEEKVCFYLSTYYLHLNHGKYKILFLQLFNVFYSKSIVELKVHNQI